MSRRPLQDIRAMNALFPAAEAEALRSGETELGAEHLILAAFDLPDGSARRAFEGVGAHPDEFRSAISAQHTDALRSIGFVPMDEALDDAMPEVANAPKGPLRSSGSAQSVFKRVVKLVRKERSQLYGAYIVLVAAESEHGTTIRALHHMNVDPVALAASAREQLERLNA